MVLSPGAIVVRDGRGSRASIDASYLSVRWDAVVELAFVLIFVFVPMANRPHLVRQQLLVIPSVKMEEDALAKTGVPVPMDILGLAVKMTIELGHALPSSRTACVGVS